MFDPEVTTHARAHRGGLRDVIRRLCPDETPAPVAAELYGVFDEIERLVAGAKTLLARRVAETNEKKKRGERRAADDLSKRAGTTTGRARRQLETSKHLAGLEKTREAVQNGELSAEQAEAIADAAAVNPAAETELLKQAKELSLPELREACGRAKAAADPNPEGTRQRIHAQRRLRTWTDSEGGWNLSARGTNTDGAAFRAALQALIDEQLDTARAEGRRESFEAYAFDALIEMARRYEQHPAAEQADPAPAKPKHLTLVRVDLESLIRGAVQGEEVCEIAGLGPIPVPIARGLLGDSILHLVITRGLDVLHLTSLGRGATAAQRIALLWQNPGCDAAGCNCRWVHIDHRHDWADLLYTTLDPDRGGLDHLCPHHHHLKTHERWALIDGTGKRPFVPPDDPRHPNNTQRPPPAG